MEPLEIVLHRRVPARARLRRVGEPHVAVVAARAHRSPADPGADRDVRAAPRRADLRDARPRARSTTGARSSSWEPPRRLVYVWHLRFDRADATEVEITFAPSPRTGGRDRGDDRPPRLGAPRRGRPRAPRAQPARLGRPRPPLLHGLRARSAGPRLARRYRVRHGLPTAEQRPRGQHREHRAGARRRVRAVVDVREDYERDAGHVAGTRHIQLASWRAAGASSTRSAR